MGPRYNYKNVTICVAIHYIPFLMVLKIKHIHISSSYKGQRIDIKPKKVSNGLVLLKLDVECTCQRVISTEFKFLKSN